MYGGPQVHDGSLNLPVIWGWGTTKQNQSNCRNHVTTHVISTIWLVLFKFCIRTRDSQSTVVHTYTSPNPWARFRIWKRPMRSQSDVYGIRIMG